MSKRQIVLIILASNYSQSPVSIISWDKICYPKYEGGLGNRRTLDVNTATLDNIRMENSNRRR